MNLQPLHPIDEVQSWIYGDVRVHPTATIAPGVLLQADPGSTIDIAAHVTIGMGSVVHARSGVVTIDQGANLGAGVLLLGAVHVGSHASLGASVTVVDQAIARNQVVAPGTLLHQDVPDSVPNSASRAAAPSASAQHFSTPASQNGPSGANGLTPDRPASPQNIAPVQNGTRHTAGPVPIGPPIPTLDPLPPSPWDEEEPPLPKPHTTPIQGGFPSAPPLPPPRPFVPPGPVTPPLHTLDPEPDPTASSSPAAAERGGALQKPMQVYGKLYLDRLMVTMFPHRQDFGDLAEAGNALEPSSPGQEEEWED
jgi:carbon dioxide concentrating mechanism protein CcmN